MIKKIVGVLPVIALLVFITLVPNRTFAFFEFVTKDSQSASSVTLFSSFKDNLISFVKRDKNKTEENFSEEPRKSVNIEKTVWVVATAYSSTPDQTDDTPFITASNTYVRDGIIAANFLPFGTFVRMPDFYGNKIFVVEDRMNKRYGEGRIDIWFPDRQSALRFGARKIKIEIVS